MADNAFQTSVTATTLRASGSLAAATTDNTGVLNLESATVGQLAATVYIAATPGASVTAGAALQINVAQSVDGGTTYPTIFDQQYQILSVASTLASENIQIMGGRRVRIGLQNTDVTNAITTCVAVYGTINSIGP